MKDTVGGCALFFYAVLLIAIFVIISARAGFDLGREHEHVKAVRAGVGRYVTDPKTGATRFVYGGMP